MNVSPKDLIFDFMGKARFDDLGVLIVDDFIVFMSFLKRKLI